MGAAPLVGGRIVTCRKLHLSFVVQSKHHFLKGPQVYDCVQCYCILMFGGFHHLLIAFEFACVHHISVPAHVIIGKPHVDLSIILTPLSREATINA